MREDAAGGGWVWVARSMAAGAAYDLVFAIAILGFLRPAARLLALEPPADPTYLRLNGVFLIVLALMYLLAAARPARYQGVVFVAVIARGLGAAYFAAVARLGPGPASTFLALGSVDLAFALLHATLLVRAKAADRASV